MKKVKRCPSCGKYNTKFQETCTECGSYLEPTILSVAKDLEYDAELIKLLKIKDTKVSNDIENKELKICPVCKSEVPVTDITCPNCGKILVNSSKKSNVDSTMTIKLVNEKLNINISLYFKPQPQVFGRNSSSNETLKDNLSISRKHFEYYLENGLAFIKDFSLNGTWIDKKKLDSKTPYPIHDKDSLKIADLTFKVTYVN